MIIIICILIACVICEGIWLYKSSRSTQEIIELNADRQRQNEQIEQEIKDNQQELEKIQGNIVTQNEIVQSLAETANNLREEAEKRAESAFAQSTKELQHKYDSLQLKLEADYNYRLSLVEEKLAQENDKLADLKAKQQAYIAAKQREEEKEANIDYYRLVLGELDKSDISLLQELKQRIVHRDAIDKVIWEIYYKPAFDTLSPHFFKSASDKKCGIYKITSLDTGAAYVGQSVDIRERWRQHIKTALSSAPATNILYQAMKKYGPENFTFEILEEVPKNKLNEREVYWIDFYDLKERGMNKTRGGA